MNIRLSGIISNVLGEFWTRTFRGKSTVDWISSVLSSVYSEMDSIQESARSSKLVLKDADKKFHAAPLSVKASLCVWDTKTISVMSPLNTDTVQQTTMKRSVLIPVDSTETILHIQSSPENPSMVWIPGSNMEVYDKEVRLYIPEGYQMPSEIVTTNEEPEEAYILYIWRRMHPERYSGDFGVLTGLSMDAVPSDIRKTLWKAYVDGVTEYDMSVVLASSGNDMACVNDSLVDAVWTEADVQYVSTVDGTVYHGHSIPSVVPGQTVRKGDLLFSGTVRFTKDSFPASEEVPAISLFSFHEEVVAPNQMLPVVKTPVGYVPQFYGGSWLSRVVSFQTKYPYVKPAITAQMNANPLRYVLSVLQRGCLSISVVRDARKCCSVVLQQLIRILGTSSPVGSRELVSVVVPEDVSALSPCSADSGESCVDIVVPDMSFNTEMGTGLSRPL